MSKLVRFLGLAVYGGFVLLVFVLTAYLSFNLFVRSGASRAPDLVGLDADQAREVLADQGFRLTVEDEGRYADGVPADHVLQQDPAPGALIKRGSNVTVVISQGPQQIQVPDLFGLGLQAAQVTLAGSSLTLGRTVDVFSPREEPGTVVGQEPRAGDRVSPSEAVHLLLAQQGSGEIYVMPDLVYLDVDRVRSFFSSRGFRLGSVKYERYEGIRPGTVLRQYPLAGHPLDRQEAVSLVVAAEPRPDTGFPGLDNEEWSDPFDDFGAASPPAAALGTRAERSLR